MNRYIEDQENSGELVKTAQDALGEIESVLYEMRSLCEEASKEEMSPYERNLAQETVDHYIAEVDRIVEEAESKAARLLDNPRSGPHKPVH